MPSPRKCADPSVSGSGCSSASPFVPQSRLSRPPPLHFCSLSDTVYRKLHSDNNVFCADSWSCFLPHRTAISSSLLLRDRQRFQILPPIPPIHRSAHPSPSPGHCSTDRRYNGTAHDCFSRIWSEKIVPPLVSYTLSPSCYFAVLLFRARHICNVLRLSKSFIFSEYFYYLTLLLLLIKQNIAL